MWIRPMQTRIKAVPEEEGADLEAVDVEAAVGVEEEVSDDSLKIMTEISFL